MYHYFENPPCQHREYQVVPTKETHYVKSFALKELLRNIPATCQHLCKERNYLCFYITFSLGVANAYVYQTNVVLRLRKTDESNWEN